MSTKIILIRHGQTDWNLKKRYCGFSDINLNERGKKQADKLSKILNKEKIHRVYSSDMKRTVQSAKIVLKNTSIEKIRGFREINFGIFEGLTYKEAMDKYSEIYTKWIANPLNFIIPKGESLNCLAKRVRKAWKKLISKNSRKTIAIFSHAGPIRIILCDLLKLDLRREFWKLNPSSASINIIEFNKRKFKIKLLNNTSYLNG